MAFATLFVTGSIWLIADQFKDAPDGEFWQTIASNLLMLHGGAAMATLMLLGALVKGRDLYYDFYQREDYEKVAKFVINKLVRQQWIVSYDNAPAIRALYKGCQRLAYNLGYSARTARQGSEVIFFGDSVRVCPLVGPFKLIRRVKRGVPS